LAGTVLPWLAAFEPDLVFVSAGFDALGEPFYAALAHV
jgi:acetoin utilization deacetylase AcuC-like enzyme